MALYVDASWKQKSKTAGAGVRLYTLTKSRKKNGDKDYWIKLQNQPSSFEAEKAGVACALSIAAYHGIQYPMIVSDCLNVCRFASLGPDKALGLNRAKLFDGLDHSFDQHFHDVRTLWVRRTNNKIADGLAHRGRRNGTALSNPVDVPSSLTSWLVPATKQTA